MRQTFVVTILLFVLAIPAALLSAWAPSTTRVAAVPTEVVQVGKTKITVVKPVVNLDSAKAKTRLMAGLEWFASVARRVKFEAPGSDNPVSLVVQAPKAVTHAATELYRSATIALAETSPTVVGSVSPSGVVAVSSRTAGPDLAARPDTVVAQKEVTAVDWRSLAADPADGEARFATGMNYLGGKGGTPDFVQAARWLMDAAERGHARAALALADLYVQGTGVERNYAAAYMWYEIAARGLPNDGTRSATLAKRDRIGSAMTAEERKIAEAAIQSWKPLSLAVTVPDQAVAGVSGN